MGCRPGSGFRMRFSVILSIFLSLIPPAYSAYPSSDEDIAREFLWEKLIRMPAAARPRVGVALSGGGARGFAHVGVLEVLTDAGFPVDCLSGTSMGAVVGAFYSSGVPISRMWELGKNITLSSVSSDFKPVHLLRLIIADKLLSSRGMENFIVKNIGDRRFDQLNIPFASVAMDFKTGEKVLFREGSVALAVRASMNLPGVFTPVEYRHRYLVDGGVVDFIPVDAAKSLGADWVLASITEGDFSRSSMDNVFLSLMQVIDIRGALLARNSRKEADFIIEPKVGNILLSELEKSSIAGEKGVTEAFSSLNGAKESLIIFSLPKMLEASGHD